MTAQRSCTELCENGAAKRHLPLPFSAHPPEGIVPHFHSWWRPKRGMGVDYLNGNILYINVMNRWSVDCDCDGSPAEPDICRNNLNFRDQGMVLGKGCGTPSMTAGSKYMDQAYRLGKMLA